jgi:predicted amidohydrolase YtcJ
MKSLFAFFVFTLPFYAHSQRAETIIYNAVVYTLDSVNTVSEAIAIGNGKILKVGENKDVLALKKKGTKVIDAGGKAVIPGIFDSHLHVIRGGRFYHAELRWDGVRSLKRALEMLKEQSQRTPRGQWVRVVGGWSAYQFEEKRLPTLEEINEATGNVPTFILYLYGHAYLNKAGLKALNIDGRTKSPIGGLIEKSLDGEPTGLLVAEPSAFLLYSTLAKLPDLSEQDKINSTIGFMRELNRFGITSVMDPGGGFQNFPGDYGVSDALCKSGDLTVRLPYFLFAQKAGKELEDYSRWIKTVEIGQSCDDHLNSKSTQYFGMQRLQYHVEGAGENLVMSAADFENFDQARPELSPAMESQLKDVLLVLVKNRWPFRIHATYNESITRFLNVIEEVNSIYPLDGLLWFFDHAETVSEDNLLRIKKLGGGIAIQHRMAFQGESFIKRYGLEAAGSAPPVKKILDLGIPLGMGSDGTRVSSYNPFIGLYWLTTGKTIGGTKHMDDDNLLSRTEALRLYTQGSASLVRMQDFIGKIEMGYQADIAILTQDYFNVADETILELEAEVTILNGKVVYASKSFQDLISYPRDLIPEWSPVRFYGGYQNGQP